MKKDAKVVKRKHNWRLWTLVIAVAILLSVLIYSFTIICFQTWLVSILFPVILSAVASVGVSWWFTQKTEKEKLYRDLLDELDKLFEYGFLLNRNIDSTLYSMLVPLGSKKRMMMNDVLRKPRLFYISRYYYDYYEYYEKKIKELIELLGQVDSSNGQMSIKTDDPFLFSYFFLVAEITDKTLKLQEQILQDYKIIPKEPIPDQLVFREKATQDKKTT